MNSRHRLVIGTVLCLIPTIVSAHTIGHGVSPFLSGLLHPVLVPAHMICLIGFGLFLGQQEPDRNLAALIVYPLATTIGLMVTLFPLVLNPEFAILVTAMIFGLLIAWNLRMPVYLCALAAACAGLLVSLDSSQQSLKGMAKAGALLGTGLGIVLIPLLAMEFTDFFRKRDWQRISIRILGSWIAASAMLVLTLSIYSLHK